MVEPFTPIGHPAFVMGAGLPLIFFVMKMTMGTLGREPVSPSHAANCLEVSAPRPEHKERRVPNNVDCMCLFKFSCNQEVAGKPKKAHKINIIRHTSFFGPRPRSGDLQAIGCMR